ncbi:hypothetical protein RAS1_18940 [Phycisphaerae bacterium RAS1]|nr:hypothetical protein RAS1_18940 [Phycisphaerae bacterium RAS1]
MSNFPAGVKPDQSHPYGAQPRHSPALFIFFSVLYLAWLGFIAAMSWYYPAI